MQNVSSNIRTTIMKLTYFLFLLIIVACNNPKDNNIPLKNSKNDLTESKMNDEIFKNKVIIILSEELEGKSNNINIQDYVQNGISFIPVFTSIENFNESTKGQVKNPKVEIDGVFLLSILQGKELLRVNPGLKSETDFNAGDLIKKFTPEIVKINAKMKSLKENN